MPFLLSDSDSAISVLFVSSVVKSDPVSSPRSELRALSASAVSPSSLSFFSCRPSTVGCGLRAFPNSNHSRTYKTPLGGGIYRSSGQTRQSIEKEAGPVDSFGVHRRHLKDQCYMEDYREASSVTASAKRWPAPSIVARSRPSPGATALPILARGCRRPDCRESKSVRAAATDT